MNFSAKQPGKLKSGTEFDNAESSDSEMSESEIFALGTTVVDGSEMMAEESLLPLEGAELLWDSLETANSIGISHPDKKQAINALKITAVAF